MNETHVVEESASTLRAVCNRDSIDTCSRIHTNMQKYSTHEYTSAHICSHKYTDTHPTHTCKSITHALESKVKERDFHLHNQGGVRKDGGVSWAPAGKKVLPRLEGGPRFRTPLGRPSV